jgi:polyisoprenoid-binding protein YceI
MKVTKFFLIVAILVISLTACAAPQAPAATATTVPTQPASPAPTSTTEAMATEIPATENPTEGVVYEVIPEKSKANYRITEQLAGNDLPNDAVGETTGISGSINLMPDGSIDKANSKITVDLSALKSDRSMRDNFVKRNVLQTDQYPQAVFVPTEIKGLPAPLPQSGSVTFQVVGDLTIRDVTKPVTWEVTGEIVNGEATGKATTNFKFSDFNLTQPKVPVVLSLEDNIILEVEIGLKPSGS